MEIMHLSTINATYDKLLPNDIIRHDNVLSLGSGRKTGGPYSLLCSAALLTRVRRPKKKERLLS